MEAFSYEQHHPFLLDSPILPSTPFEMPLQLQQVGEMNNNSPSCFPCYFSPEAIILGVSSVDTGAYESSSSLDTAKKAPSVESQIAPPSLVNESHDEKVPKHQGSMEKKRKYGDGTCLCCGQSKVRIAEIVDHVKKILSFEWLAGLAFKYFLFSFLNAVSCC